MSKFSWDSDYSQLIDFIEKQPGGFGIKTKIKTFYENYRTDNPAVLIEIMEAIERKYKDIVGFEDFHTQDVINFSEQRFEIKYPKVEYAYSYLIYLQHSDTKYENSDVSPETLKRIFLMLSDGNWIDKSTTFERFEKFFLKESGKKSDLSVAKLERIKWIKPYNGRPSPTTLVAFLRYVCNKKIAFKKEFAFKICAHFKSFSGDFRPETIVKLCSDTNIAPEELKPTRQLSGLIEIFEAVGLKTAGSQRV